MVTNITPLFTMGGASCPPSTPVEKLQTGSSCWTLLSSISSSPAETPAIKRAAVGQPVACLRIQQALVSDCCIVGHHRLRGAEEWRQPGYQKQHQRDWGKRVCMWNPPGKCLNCLGQRYVFELAFVQCRPGGLMQ